MYHDRSLRVLTPPCPDRQLEREVQKPAALRPTSQIEAETGQPAVVDLIVLWKHRERAATQAEDVGRGRKLARTGALKMDERYQDAARRGKADLHVPIGIRKKPARPSPPTPRRTLFPCLYCRCPHAFPLPGFPLLSTHRK